MSRSAWVVVAALAAVALLLALRALLVTDPLERLARDGDRYQGSWLLPRGGPYILGFESPGAAELWVDDRRVASGTGEQSSRHVFAPGVYSVRFLAPRGARLLWHPPGRRGPLEYVPVSSLSPQPPPQAQFGRWAGASPVDGVIAAAIVLVAFAALAYLLRRSLQGIGRRRWLLLLAVFAAAAAIRLVDLSAAGQTWDEDVNWSAGRNYITNVLALDARPASWRWNLEHPPVMKYLAGIGAQLADGYGPARALSALIMAATCALLVLIGERLYSLRVGVLAGAIAALSPHLIAHGKVVGHEAPTALLWTLAVLLCLRCFDSARPYLPSRQLAWRFAGLGVVLGLALFSRFVNGLLAPLIGTLLLLGAPRGQHRRVLVLGLAIIPAVAILVGLIIWPRLWHAPIAHLLEAWQTLRKPHAPEPYLGVITNVPPRHYFLVYLLATAPLGVLVAAAGWLARLAAQPRPWRSHAALALWLVMPLAVMLSPVRQDGVRYIMPSLVALSVIAAAGIEFAASLAGRHARVVFTIASAAFIAYLVITAARIHPYYLDYYGEHVGGPARVAANDRFEVGWWGEGLQAALAFLNREAPRGARVYKGCVLPAHLAWLRHDLWEREARRADDADWILWYAASNCEIPREFRLVFEESAQGAPLARVYRR